MRAIASPYNRYQYSDKEWNNELKWNDHGARMYDPAVGRWWVTDPANQYASPYKAMGNNPVSHVDKDGQFAWFVPVIIGAALGGTAGGFIAQNNGQKFWKGAIVGAIAGAGIGLGFSAAFSNTISGITESIYVNKLSTAAWNITSNALITANVNMVSSAIQGRGLDGVMQSGLVGLASGGIGGYLGGKFNNITDASEDGFRFFSDKAIKATNLITAGLNGFGDRYTYSLHEGEGSKQALINGLFGLGEGLYFSHFIGNKLSGVKGSYSGGGATRFYKGLTGRYLSAFVGQAGTSVPGFGNAVAYWHQAGGILYHGFFGNPWKGGVLFASYIGTTSAYSSYRATYTRAILDPFSIFR